MPRVSDAVPAEGDYYPTVRAWMARLGATDLDQLANRTKVTKETARLYVSAVLGVKFPLRFRRMSASAGRGGSRGITLDPRCRAFTLGTVLHEIAHARQGLMLKDQRKNRQKRRMAGKMTVYGRGWVKAAHHGEAFCRTYAKLLREVME
jgi:hypothetical protein